MMRQSEHLQCRRRQALAIFSLIVIFYIDFSCADNPNNNAEDTAIPAVFGRLHPLKLVGEIRDKTAGIGQGITTILKEPAQKDFDNLENLMNAANQKSPENPVVSDNNGGAVQSDESDESDSVSYHYMQSHLGQGITMILKEPGQKDLDNLENLMNDANQKSSENSDVSDNNGGAVQSDESDESDSVPYHYMQSQLSNRRIGNSYRFGGKG